MVVTNTQGKATAIQCIEARGAVKHPIRDRAALTQQRMIQLKMSIVLRLRNLDYRINQNIFYTKGFKIRQFYEHRNKKFKKIMTKHNSRFLTVKILKLFLEEFIETSDTMLIHYFGGKKHLYDD